MLIDITLKVTPQLADSDNARLNPTLAGHLGTHFDVMEQEFPLEYTRRNGIVFDVREVNGRDITEADVDLDKVNHGMFVAFYSGYIEEAEYGTPAYYAEHPQLSVSLLEALLEKGVSIIALDFAGVRRGKEHTPMDRRCAEKGTFVVENLYGLGEVFAHGCTFTAHTYPMRFTNMTGLPCRVLAEV